MITEPADEMRTSPIPPTDHARPQSRPVAAPAKLAIALVPACGLLVWIALSFASGRGLTPPDFSYLARSFRGWTSIGAVTSPQSPVTVSAAGEQPHVLTPLQCQSSSQSSIGASLTIRPTEVVCGDVLVVGGSATVQGEIRGSLQVIGGSADVSGDVTGDVSVIGGDIIVKNGGQISGAAHAIGGSVITTPNSIVRNVGTDLQQPRDITRPPGFNFSVDVGSFWLSVLFWLSAAFGISLFAPEMVGRVRYTVTHHFMLSGLMGAALAVVGGLVALVLIVTCLGIPVALLLAIAGWVGWVVGTVGVGAWLGSIMFGGHRRQPSLRLSAVLGALILCLLKALPVAGAIVGVVAGLVALGASVLTLLSARRAPGLRRAY